MTVHDQAHAEDTVENGVVGAACDERGDGEGDAAGGEDTLECPVLRAVRFGGSREGRGVVYGAPVDRCSRFVSMVRKSGAWEIYAGPPGTYAASAAPLAAVVR